MTTVRSKDKGGTSLSGTRRAMRIPWRRPAQARERLRAASVSLSSGSSNALLHFELIKQKTKPTQDQKTKINADAYVIVCLHLAESRLQPPAEATSAFERRAPRMTSGLGPASISASSTPFYFAVSLRRTHVHYLHATWTAAQVQRSVIL